MRKIERALKVINFLEQDRLLKERNKIGWCRLWTEGVLDLVEQYDGIEEIQAEAREVHLEVGLNHTFVRLECGGEFFLWDGVGTARHEPYFGLEKRAPEYLQNSHEDMIGIRRRVIREQEKKMKI